MLTDTNLNCLSSFAFASKISSDCTALCLCIFYIRFGIECLLDSFFFFFLREKLIMCTEHLVLVSNPLRVDSFFSQWMLLLAHTSTKVSVDVQMRSPVVKSTQRGRLDLNTKAHTVGFFQRTHWRPPMFWLLNLENLFCLQNYLETEADFRSWLRWWIFASKSK